MNLIFSVLCGCITGFWAQGWGQLEDNPTALVSEIEQHKDEINAQIKESAQQSRSRRRGQPDVQVSTEKEVDFEAIKDGLLAAANSPSTPLVRKATLIAGISQAVLLIGSILLLMHKNAGRVLSMLALMGFIGGTIVAAMKFPGVASAIVDGIKDPSVTTSAPELQDALEVGVWGVSAVSLVWPAIALLILLASRSIREACQRTYPMA